MVKKFPDLTGDGKVTQKDILKGRGVELKRGGTDKKKKTKKKRAKAMGGGMMKKRAKAMGGGMMKKRMKRGGRAK